MQELSQEIREVTEEKTFDVPAHLRETAKKWANHCLDKFDGDLLKKGLAISAAIVNFLNEREER